MLNLYTKIKAYETALEDLKTTGIQKDKEYNRLKREVEKMKKAAVGTEKAPEAVFPAGVMKIDSSKLLWNIQQIDKIA